MNCSQCGHPIPPAEIACRACLEQRARMAAILAAARHIPDYLYRGLDMRMAQRSRFVGPLHLCIPNFHETFCGEPLKDLKHRTALKLSRALPVACRKCKQRFEQLLDDHQPKKEKNEHTSALPR